MNQQLAVKSNGKGVMNHSALAIVDEKLASVARFLKMTLPYGKDLTDENAIALAGYQQQFGLSAANGECYFLVRVNKDTGERIELGLYPGIKGYRKKSNEQLQAVDKLATYKVEYEQVSPTEMGVPAEKAGDYAVCVRAKLTDTVSRTKYLVDYVELKKLGLSGEEIETLIGKPPFWYGYGAVTKKELWALKMLPLRAAEKRAEKDATSRRFHLPFSDDLPAGDDLAGAVLDSIEGGFEPSPAKLEKPKKSEAQLMSELGFQDANMPEVSEGEFHDETPPDLNLSPEPYADLRKLAETDPSTAFWKLQKAIGCQRADALAIVKECKDDMAKAFAALLRNAPPA